MWLLLLLLLRCRLTPNAFRNEGMTMQARIAAMKEQNWVDSDEFVKANATSLSPECRDLLDKIFIADEFKRITLQVGFCGFPLQVRGSVLVRQRSRGQGPAGQVHLSLSHASSCASHCR
jgi:hypothetical protein